MRILAIANETTMQTMHLIRFLFTRRLRIPATTVSHWTNNFSRRDSNKWKSDVQFFPCMSVTPATPPINATKFTFGHSSQFLAIFHSQICNRRKPFLTEKQKSKKKELHIYMNCPPYFLHCLCLCFLCSTNILWLRYFHFSPENLLSFSQLAPLLRLLLLLRIFSYFPSFFILSVDFRCSQCARCWHERSERKLWMLSFVFWPNNIGGKWTVGCVVCGAFTQRCVDVCALVICFPRTLTTHTHPKWKSDVGRCVRVQSRKMSWLDFFKWHPVELISIFHLTLASMH